MVGDDDYTVILVQIIQACAGHLQVILTAPAHKLEVRIVVAHLRSLLLQQFDDCQRWRFAEIVDILLICHPQDQNFRSVDGLSALVQGLAYAIHHVIGHVQVDFAGEFNKPRAEIEFLGLPGQIKRIDWDAMASQPRPRVERLESERLCGCGFDNFPNIDTHAQR